MTPTPTPPPPARRPFTAQMTARNIVHLVLTIAVVGVLAALYAGVQPPAGIDAAHVQTACYALLVGLFVPGSPVGRILDAYFPPAGQPTSAPTLEDLSAAKDALLPPAPPPQRIPPTRRDGFAHIGVLAYVLGAFVFFAAGCALLSGCGASALSNHASGVAVAMVAVRGAEDMADAERRSAEDACTSEACLLAAQTARAPVVSAIDTARTAVLAWRDAVAVAIQASDPSADLLAALETAAARAIARWADLVAALHPLGVDIPALPASVAALVPHGGAS